MKLLPARYFGRATGLHRKTRPASAPGAIVGQRFVYCPGCGDLVSHTVHGQLLVCADGHEQPAGGA